MANLLKCKSINQIKGRLPQKATPSLVSLRKISTCSNHTGKLKTDIEPETDAFWKTECSQVHVQLLSHFGPQNKGLDSSLFLRNILHPQRFTQLGLRGWVSYSRFIPLMEKILRHLLENHVNSGILTISIGERRISEPSLPNQGLSPRPKLSDTFMEDWLFNDGILTYEIMNPYKIPRWWLNQPIWKICNRQIGSLPQGSRWK